MKHVDLFAKLLFDVGDFRRKHVVDDVAVQRWCECHLFPGIE